MLKTNSYVSRGWDYELREISFPLLAKINVIPRWIPLYVLAGGEVPARTNFGGILESQVDIMNTIRKFLSKLMNQSTTMNRKFMISELKKRKGNFLEVGPGLDPLLKNLTHIPNEKKIVMDLPGEVDLCRNFGYKCLEQDAGIEKWNLPDESIELVVSHQCLEHIPYTDHFISEAARVLKKDGIFLISVPNQGALFYILLLIFTINPPMSNVSDIFIGLGNPFYPERFKRKAEFAGHAHLRLFSTRALNDLLRVYGFKILRNHGGSWGIPFIGKSLAALFPYYGLFSTVLAQKL